MLQSQVEIKHYSIAYLSHSKHCGAELPLGAGLIHTALMDEYLISLHVAHTSHTLNGHSALLHFKRSNVVENTRIITFDFYPGLMYHTCMIIRETLIMMIITIAAGIYASLLCWWRDHSLLEVYLLESTLAEFKFISQQVPFLVS